MKLLSSIAALSLMPIAALAQDVMATTDLNIRSGPGSNADILGVIPAEGMAMLDGCVGGTRWCQVTYDGTTGFAYADYLAFTADASDVVVSDAVAIDPDPEFTAADVAGALVGVDAETAVTMAEDQGAAEEFVMSDPAVDPVYLDGEVVIGAGVPVGVNLIEIPDNGLSYANINGLQVLVDPTSRQIVSVVR